MTTPIRSALLGAALFTVAAPAVAQVFTSAKTFDPSYQLIADYNAYGKRLEEQYNQDRPERVESCFAFDRLNWADPNSGATGSHQPSFHGFDGLVYFAPDSQHPDQIWSRWRCVELESAPVDYLQQRGYNAEFELIPGEFSFAGNPRYESNAVYGHRAAGQRDEAMGNTAIAIDQIRTRLEAWSGEKTEGPAIIIEDVAQLAIDTVNMVVDLAGDCADLDCPPTGGPQEIGDDLEEMVWDAAEQAQQVVDAAIALAGGATGPVNETLIFANQIAHDQIEFAFEQLNGTLLIVFGELNHLIQTLPGETQGMAQFVVDTGNSQVATTIEIAQSQVMFALGMTESTVGVIGSIAGVLQQALWDILATLPLHGNETACNEVVNQSRFALDNLVLRFLDEERAADQLIFVLADGVEGVARANCGYAAAVEQGGQVNGQHVIDNTTAVTGATVIALVDAGYAAFAAGGNEAIYQDIVCNRLSTLNLCQENPND